MEHNLYFTIRYIKHWAQYIDAFWELHPSATKMGSLCDLYTKDKSKNKIVSSRKAWFCVLYCHPESDFYNLNHEEKLKDLAGDLFTVKANKTKTYESLIPVIKYIESAVLTKSHRQLVVLHKKLQERLDLYEKTPYNINNVDLLDKMLKSEKTIMAAIQECEDIIKESAKDGSLKGGGELGFMEGGGLFD